MNIHEQHVAELYAAQDEFNKDLAVVHDVYAQAVQRSRDKLLAALNGKPEPANTEPVEPMPTTCHAMPKAHTMPAVDMSAMESELNAVVDAEYLKELQDEENAARSGRERE